METSKKKRGRKPKKTSTAETMDLQFPSPAVAAASATSPCPSPLDDPDPSEPSSGRTRGRPRKIPRQNLPSKDKAPKSNIIGKPPPPSQKRPHASSSSIVTANGDCAITAGDPPPPKWEQVAKAVPSMDAVVKVFCVHTEPNFSLPWQRKRQYSSSSSGFIIGGRRVLTNAHSVEHHTQVKLKKRGSDTKYLATVLAIATECDIAMLTVSDDEFWEGVSPVEFGPLPALQDAVTVVGYPIGGDTISVTSGVVSRIEILSYVHGSTELLGLQIDAAINSGNSGGPAFNDTGKCVGIAFQSLKHEDVDNIGYVIPTPVILHFIHDYEKSGEYTGFPMFGFGAVGTWISFAIISLGAMTLFMKLDIGSLEIRDYLAIGAIFSATDSVCTLQVLNQDETPLLYSLVFGEGVVNDATSVVLFHAIQNNFDVDHIKIGHMWKFIAKFIYLFTTSTFLGAFTGLFSAYVNKKLCIGRYSTDREVALMSLMAYLSYLLAVLLDLSGILTVFFCGIVMSHYTWYTMTGCSRITTKHAFATFSFIAEIFIFLYVGMDALDIEKWKLVENSPGKSVAVSAIILFLVLVGRAAFIFPLSCLSNLAKKLPNEKITFKQQVTIWWAGLMRGAVSIALAYNQFTSAGHTQLRGNAMMITSTITVVLFSTMVFGLLTKPIIRLLLPPGEGHCCSVSELTTTDSSLIPLLGDWQGSEIEAGGKSIPRPHSIRMLISKPAHTVHHFWRKFDDTFMRPVFGGRGFVPYAPSSPAERGVHAQQRDGYHRPSCCCSVISYSVS